VDEQISMAVDLLVKALLTRVGAACQHPSPPSGAMAADQQNESKPPELLWIQINALLAALVLLLMLLIYFFPKN
jgi:hypothetical protein